LTVTDASVLVFALVDVGRATSIARDRLAGEAALQAPHVVDLEVAAGLRRSAERGTIEDRHAESGWVRLRAMQIERFPHVSLLERIWSLRSTVTLYDAAYVALAEVLETTLVTFDARLARAPGPRCRIELLA
jgi:predicted nucleic acid-binding protein